MADIHKASTEHSKSIKLGVITTAHGVRGQVKIRSFTAIPENIIAYGPLSDKKGNVYTIALKGHTNDALIAAIEGVATREAAEKLRNTELFVPRSALPAPAEGEYYHEDLVGLRLATSEGEPYGVITAIHNFGAGDLADIKKVSGQEEMLPFNRSNFPLIDISAGTAVVVPPELIKGEQPSV